MTGTDAGGGRRLGRDLAAVVAAHPLLAGLPADVATLVAGCTRNVAVAAGDRLFAEGDPADTLYLLRRGRVALEVRVPGRGTVVVETLHRGQVVGWSWLVPPYTWQLDARATEPVGALAVDATCLRAKADADPAFGYELMKRLSAIVLDRLQATRLRLLDVYAPPARSAPSVGAGLADEGPPPHHGGPGAVTGAR